MTPLHRLAIATIGACAITASALALRRREHAPAAVALFALFACNVLQAMIGERLAPYPVEPWQGTARVLVHIDTAVVLGAAEIVPALALSVTLSGQRRAVALALVALSWALASAVLATLYPAPFVRGEGLFRLYLAADLVCLTVASAALISRLRTMLANRESPRPRDAVAISLVALDLGILMVPFSPWREGLWITPYGRFDIVQVGVVIFFAGLSAVHGALWIRSSSQ